MKVGRSRGISWCGSGGWLGRWWSLTRSYSRCGYFNRGFRCGLGCGSGCGLVGRKPPPARILLRSRCGWVGWGGRWWSLTGQHRWTGGRLRCGSCWLRSRM